MKTLIKNGLIYDGTGGKPYKGDIFIENDRIVDICPSGILSNEISTNEPTAKNNIDKSDLAYNANNEMHLSLNNEERNADLVFYADNKAVTPGFIDSHRHCDIAAVADPNFGEVELAQGITTVLGGNCGLTPFPYVAGTGQQMLDFIEPVLGKAPEWMKYASYPEYMAALEASNPFINVGQMLGTGAVKTAVKGFGKSPYTQSEMDKAKGYIREAMEAGVFGISTGIMYVPECYSTTAELTELIKSAAKYKRILTFHIRGEGDSLVSSVEEVLKIGRDAEVPINISHFKAVGIENWQKTIYQAIDKIEEARASGQDVSVDFYPYTGGSTTLMSLLPPSVQETDIKDTLRNISTTEGAKLLKNEINRKHDNWDNTSLNIGWDRIIISYVTKPANKDFVGDNIQDLAYKNGYEDPVDFFRELLIDEQGKVGVIQMSMDQHDVDTIAKLPYSMVISDSLYGNADSPHPRLFGSFPRIIQEFVYKRKILSLETAINKMTQMTAERFQIDRRGTLEVGNYADINIFNPKNLKDLASYSKPKKLSIGLDMAFINGRLVWNNNKMIRAYRAGAIRHI
ncbi:MAG: amidohydrolase family protein [Clostridiales bacterium]|nr:amidohydrolase family protein [Clostridiales bacterium]